MRVKDVTLPGPDDGDQWCELLIHTATPEVGKQWTDTCCSRGRRAAFSRVRSSAERGAVRVRPSCPPHVFESPTGRRAYDNRHTRLTKWLNDGIPPAQVAEWAGNSVPVLLATYARCVEGQLPDLKRRLEAAGDLPELPDAH